jgi:hypothetical protein
VSHERLKHRGGQVIDALIAEIFERVEHDALARSREPADQNESQRGGQKRNRAGRASVTRPSPLLGVMIGGLFFALLDQAIEFVGQRVDSCVHVFGVGIGMDIFAADL